MLLYLVRHGQSAGNIPGSSAGGNPDLSDIGMAQAEAAGRALAGAGIATILASPLTRALRTAHLMAKHVDAVVEAWPELAETDRKAWKVPRKKREAHFLASGGHGVGLTANQVLREFPGTKAVGFFGDEHWWVELWSSGRGGTYRRARNVVRRIAERCGKHDEAVAVVAHGAFGSVLLATLTECPPTDYNRFSQYNCGISLVEIGEHEVRLRFHNRVEHLPEGLRTDLT